MSVELLKETLKDYDQFRNSKLQNDIMKDLNCNYTTAFEKGQFHCNMLSLYGILFAKGYIKMSYAEFFKFCLTTDLSKTLKLCNDKGYLYATKMEVFKALNITATVDEFIKIPPLNIGDMFQVSINKLHHFMAAGVEDDGLLHLYDTHTTYRGQYGGEITAALKINNDKIDWVKRIN